MNWSTHLGSTETGWWLWLMRSATGSNSVTGYGIAWGWDDDVPWSWLPTVHHEQRSEQQPNGEIRQHAHLWWSWLGFTIGGLLKSKWLIDGGG